MSKAKASEAEIVYKFTMEFDRTNSIEAVLSKANQVAEQEGLEGGFKVSNLNWKIVKQNNNDTEYLFEVYGKFHETENYDEYWQAGSSDSAKAKEDPFDMRLRCFSYAIVPKSDAQHYGTAGWVPALTPLQAIREILKIHKVSLEDISEVKDTGSWEKFLEEGAGHGWD